MKLLRASFLNRPSPRFALDPPPKISDISPFLWRLEKLCGSTGSWIPWTADQEYPIFHRKKTDGYKHVGNGRKLEQHVQLHIFHIKTYTRRIYFLNPKNSLWNSTWVKSGPPTPTPRRSPPSCLQPEGSGHCSNWWWHSHHPWTCGYGGSKLACPVPVYFWDWYPPVN